MIIQLAPGVPVNLYTATGISVGTKLHLQNITGNRVRISTSDVGLGNDYNVVDNTVPWVNETTDAGAWVICAIGYCDINVRVA